MAAFSATVLAVAAALIGLIALLTVFALVRSALHSPALPSAETDPAAPLWADDPDSTSVVGQRQTRVAPRIPKPDED